MKKLSDKIPYRLTIIDHFLSGEFNPIEILLIQKCFNVELNADKLRIFILL